ncbi:MAG TPA: glycosyltransferase [Streptosporangiaceae bacterium]
MTRQLLEQGHPLQVSGRAAAQVEIVVPVLNEERDLGPSVRRLDAFLDAGFPFTARITIADNGSTDGTWATACALAGALPRVHATRLAEPGRGRALRAVWSGSDADVLAYLDVDLSTDLNALLPLVAPLLSGHSDVAIGTRLGRGARVIRGPRREILSRGYNLLLHAALGARFSDAQCGFKAISRARAGALLPLATDPGWFFDTELLILAQRAGLRIHEVPVDWTDDLDSRVRLLPTVVADLRGIARLGAGLGLGRITVPQLGREPGTAARRRQLARFVVVGAASTAGYVALYLLLRTVAPAQLANAVSLLVTAVASTAANRRLTFGVRGRAGAVRHQARGLAAFGAGLALTAAALAGLHAAVPQPGRALEMAVLITASLVATVLRFALYRGWVFRSGAGSEPAGGRPGRSAGHPAGGRP